MGIPVLFYAVPVTNPPGPLSVFIPRWWDAKMGWIRTQPSSAGPEEWLIYRGNFSVPPVGKPEGDPDWWLNGLSYERYLADGYPVTTPCVVLPPSVYSPVGPGRSTAKQVSPSVTSYAPVGPGKATANSATWKVVRALGDGHSTCVTIPSSASVDAPGRSTALDLGDVSSPVDAPGRSTAANES